MRFFLLSVLLLIPFQSFAGEYTVTPRVIEQTVTARDMLEEGIKISNTGSTPIRLFPTVNAIELGETGEILEFKGPVSGDQTTDIASWLAISRARVELAPGESIRLPLSIKVNPNAKPGDYYAFIGFAEGSKRDEAESLVMSGKAPGVTLHLTISDTSTEFLRLHRFTVDRFVGSGGDSPLVYELENVGDLPVVPSGEVILYDVRGQEVGSITINEEAKTIAPGTTQTFTANVPDTNAYGRHKAFLSLEYGTKQRAMLYDTTFFTVIPIPLLIGVFLLLLVASVALTIIYHRRHQAALGYDDESVSLYVRSGVHTNTLDHDINLKDN